MLVYISNSELVLYCIPFEFNVMSLVSSTPIICLKNSLKLSVLTEIARQVEDSARTSVANKTGSKDTLWR